MRIQLESSGLSFGATRVDFKAPDAVTKAIALLGPVQQTTVAGVDGTGRVAHWLSTGVVLVSRCDDGELRKAWFCFDQEVSLFPQRVSRPALFRGSLSVAGHELSGATRLSELGKWPGLVGFPAMWPSIEIGELYVGIRFLRARNRFQKRTGKPYVAAVAAEWGGVKGFPPRPPKRGPAST